MLIPPEKDPFPSARHDAEAARTSKDTPQTRSHAYQLSFLDEDFMLRDEIEYLSHALTRISRIRTLREQGNERSEGFKGFSCRPRVPFARIDPRETAQKGGR